MVQQTYHKYNFFKQTYCVFQELHVEDFPYENKKADYISASGSSYYYTDEGVYRISNHWGRAAKCRWRLAALPGKKAQKNSIGYAKWSSFFRDNDSEKLYCIVFKESHLVYVHKEEPIAEGRILRTASDTYKVMKRIEGILKRAKYLEVNQLESQINKLIFK